LQNRKNGRYKRWEDVNGKDRDDFLWLLCTNRQGHELERLMLTQIIVKDALTALGRKMHDIRSQYGIKQQCSCPANKEVAKANGIIKVKSEEVNGGAASETNGGSSNPTSPKTNSISANVNGDKEAENSPLSVLADVALSGDKKEDTDIKSPASSCKKTVSVGATGWDSSESESDEEKDESHYSTLRELLIRPAHKSGDGRSGSSSPTNIKQEDGGVKSEPEESVDLAAESKVQLSHLRPELKNFKRAKVFRVATNRLPWRVMTLAKSKLLYPNVPHQWQCDGRLLVLTDPAHVDNMKIFQDQWKRGQPVIVMNVAARLQHDLWQPQKFGKDFGEQTADLINCLNGSTVPSVKIKHFWKGFENFADRLKDKTNTQMILKLKDWPPGEDFADMLPSHMIDLMQALPMSDYTHRNGKLNIASRSVYSSLKF